MRIEVIRLHDNDLRREVFRFDVSLPVSGRGITARLTSYTEGRRLTRRHRTWMSLREWRRWDNRYGLMPAPLDVPADVSDEVITVLTGGITVSKD